MEHIGTAPQSQDFVCVENKTGDFFGRDELKRSQGGMRLTSGWRSSTPLSACEHAQAGGGPCLHRRTLVPVYITGQKILVWLYIVKQKLSSRFRKLRDGFWGRTLG